MLSVSLVSTVDGDDPGGVVQVIVSVDSVGLGVVAGLDFGGGRYPNAAFGRAW
jgi:hypothetical protein